MSLDHNHLSALPEGLFAGLSSSRKCGWTTTSSVHFPKDSFLVSRGSRKCGCTTTSSVHFPKDSLLVSRVFKFGSSPQCHFPVDSLLVSRVSRSGWTTTSSVHFPKDSLLVSRVSRKWALQQQPAQCTSRRTLCWSLEAPGSVAAQQPAQCTSRRTLCWSLESSNFGAEQQPAQCTSRRTLCWSLEAPGSGAGSQQHQCTSRWTLCWSLESPESVAAQQQPQGRQWLKIFFPFVLKNHLRSSGLPYMWDMLLNPAVQLYPVFLFIGASNNFSALARSSLLVNRRLHHLLPDFDRSDTVPVPASGAGNRCQVSGFDEKADDLHHLATLAPMAPGVTKSHAFDLGILSLPAFDRSHFLPASPCAFWTLKLRSFRGNACARHQKLAFLGILSCAFVSPCARTLKLRSFRALCHVPRKPFATTHLHR